MADWNTAYNFMMDNEDGPRACAQIPDAPEQLDPVSGERIGAYAISGVNSAAWPAEFAAIAALPQNQREPLVQQFYQNHVWNQWLAQLVSDDVCKRVFDFAVNAGGGKAVRCLQQAVNSLAAPGVALLTVDGGWGPMTLKATNAADPTALTLAFQTQRVADYQAIAANNPNLAKYLPEWTARAER
ncbi:MAG: putative peptidoglycan-binding domain-containing protein [Terracidiphilus sp.]|jgi:lysozyme family protein